MKPHAFSQSYPDRAREIRSEIGCSFPSGSLPTIPNPTIFTGIWDTGASSSMISSDVVQRLGLTPISHQVFQHAAGNGITNVYLVNLFLPNGIVFQNIRVGEGVETLIGMDIISQGDLSITNRDGKTLFSFQIPSTHHYDFQKQIANSEHTKK